RHYAFDDDEARGLDALEGAGHASVRAEIVDGPVDRVALFEREEVRDEELAFERVGVVEVLLVARVQREVREVAIVEVEWEERGFELRGELAREGCFAGAGTAGDADENGMLREAELFWRAHGSSVRVHGRSSWKFGILEGCIQKHFCSF